MINLEDCDIITLFTYRYLLDNKNDIVDLKQDIVDLKLFPERLKDSYLDEWKAYIKRQIGMQKAQALHSLNDDSLAAMDKEYLYLKDIVQTTQAINSADNVVVAHSPLRAYIERLIKA